MVAREIAARELVSHPPVVIPNGVDLSIFRPSHHPPSAREQTILFVGRLVSQKGVDVLLRAFRVLLFRFPAARLIIAGDGYEALYLQRLSRYLGIFEEVSFLGWQSASSLVRLYQNARAVAIPSRYEPFGLVALEALACATPVVASETGGLAEIIRNGVDGYLVPPDDHLRFAHRLAILVSDSSYAAELGKVGRIRAAQFSWASVATETQALYKETYRRSHAHPDLFSRPFEGERFDEEIESINPSIRPEVRKLMTCSG